MAKIPQPRLGCAHTKTTPALVFPFPFSVRSRLHRGCSCCRSLPAQPVYARVCHLCAVAAPRTGSSPPAPIPAPRRSAAPAARDRIPLLPCVISERFELLLEVFLEDNAAASSPGNPSVPESSLAERSAQIGRKQRGEIGFPKSGNLLPLREERETSTKPKLGFSAGSEVQETERPQPFKPGFRFSFMPSMRNQGKRGKISIHVFTLPLPRGELMKIIPFCSVWWLQTPLNAPS